MAKKRGVYPVIQKALSLDDAVCNSSTNDSFEQVLACAQVGRRGFLKGSSFLAAASMLGMGMTLLT